MINCYTQSYDYFYYIFHASYGTKSLYTSTTHRVMSGVDSLVPPNDVGGTRKNSKKLIMGW